MIVVDVILVISLVGLLSAGCVLTARTLRRVAQAARFTNALREGTHLRYALTRDGRDRDVYAATSIFEAQTVGRPSR